MNLVSKIFAEESTSLVVNPGPNFKITDIAMLVSSVANILLIIAAIAAFLFLILGGLQWITSGGDKSGMEQARNKITHAIVGLIIVAAAYAIMLLVSNFLGLSIFEKGGISLPKPY